MRRDDLSVVMEFLTARLREDETAARALKPGKNQDVARLRDRVLADVEAKRRLIDWVEEIPRRAEDTEDRALWQKAAGELYARHSRDLRSPVIYELLEAYVDHPDFHPEWKLIEDEYESGEYNLSTRAQGQTV